MSSYEEIKNERIKKRDILINSGINPYPSKREKTHSVLQFKTNFDKLIKRNETISLSGRVTSVRQHGGSVFIDLFDSGEKAQCFISKGEIGEEQFKMLLDTLDIGDFAQMKGLPFYTKRGSFALKVKEWLILTKSLQAIPDSYYGLQDDDERYRKRYLDILLDLEKRNLFILKARFWDAVRNFMKKHDFLEVETPTLEITTGGAEARPFKTYHNDYDLNVYLRISVGELWQKHLMAAGYEKTFEIGRVFRNEGTSPEHLQEFTNMEFYWAYADYRDGMSLVKDMYITIANEVFSTTKFSARGHEFDLADEWVEIDYVQEIKDQIGVDVINTSSEELVNVLRKLEVVYAGDTRERLIDTLWKYCRKQISGPAFLVNHPKIVAPLAKTIPGTETVEMFQPILAGSEVGRGYSELNDPIEQKERFVVQQALLDSGDEEAMMPDWEFVEMLEYGMPPTCGYGFGERLFSFLAGLPIRETQIFPLMRPKNNKNS